VQNGCSGFFGKVECLLRVLTRVDHKHIFRLLSSARGCLGG
jgi:hypothetical protein